MQEPVPFIQLAIGGQENTVQLLLSNNADAYLFHESGTTPLYMACCKGLPLLCNSYSNSYSTAELM